MIRSFFRHGSNALLAAGAALLLAAGSASVPPLRPWAVALGVLLFFSSEYGTHRFVLHAPPAPPPFRALQHRLHYDHHLAPERLDLLFLPPWFLLPALGCFAAVYALVWRDPSVVASLVLGNVLGLLYYEWVHYVAHTPLRPRTAAGRWLKKYHLRHHFKNEKLWFGVTNPVLDFICGTYAPVARVERSKTTRTLFR